MKKKKILVIGSSSYIGKSIIDILSKKKDFEVYSSYFSKKQLVKPNVNQFKLDLTNPRNFLKIPNDVKIIINCACIKKKYYNNLNKIVNNNIISAYRLIDYINSQLNIEKLIYLSSVSVYGFPKKKKLEKNTKISNPSLYGSLKYLEENIFLSKAKDYSVLCIRLPGILDKEAKYSLIPKLYEDILVGKNIKIFNPNGKFNNILSSKDLSKFIFLLCKYNYMIKTAFPIAANNPVSLIDVVHFIKDRLNSSSDIKIMKPEDVCRFICNNYIKQTFKYESKTVIDTLKQYLNDKTSDIKVKAKQ